MDRLGMAGSFRDEIDAAVVRGQALRSGAARLNPDGGRLMKAMSRQRTTFAISGALA
jgi:hypothetical protein